MAYLTIFAFCIGLCNFKEWQGSHWSTAKWYVPTLAGIAVAIAILSCISFLKAVLYLIFN